MVTKLLSSRLSLPALAIIGLAVAIIITKAEPPIPHNDKKIAPKIVDTIEAQVIPFRARAVGYGSVEPATFLQANAEVSGKVIYLHPNLTRGSTLRQGEIAVKIDPTNYRLALAKAEAELIINKADLEELRIEKKQLDISLAIAKRNLTIGENELKRKKKLNSKGSLAKSTVDTEEQKVLSLRQNVQDLQSKISLLPTREKVIQAQINRARAQLKEQEKNLARTKITMPFTGRIGEVLVEQDEFVASNNRLFNASDVASVEISAELPISHVRPLFFNEPALNSLTTQTPSELSSTHQTTIPSLHPVLSNNLLQQMNIDVTVRLVSNLNIKPWQGRPIRIGEILDPTSRTISFIVAIDNPYEKAIPGRRPPLIQGMYTEVEFIAQARPHLTIPRHAIHQNKVYIATTDNTLEIRDIKIKFLQGDLAVISNGITAGEQVILNDLIPAVNGMSISASLDQAMQQRINALANGDEKLK